MSLFVFRKGAHYLQGENGWGQRSCARQLTRAEATRIAKEWTAILQLSPERAAEVLGIEPADGSPT